MFRILIILSESEWYALSMTKLYFRKLFASCRLVSHKLAHIRAEITSMEAKLILFVSDWEMIYADLCDLINCSSLYTWKHCWCVFRFGVMLGYLREQHFYLNIYSGCIWYVGILSIKIQNSVPHCRAQILLAIFGTVYRLHFALAR